MSEELRTTSSLVKRQLGLRLVSLRDDLGLSLRDVDASGVFSAAKLSRIERGMHSVDEGDVLALCKRYRKVREQKLDRRLTPEELASWEEVVDALCVLAQTTKDKGWPSDSIPEGLSLYAGLEAMASRIRAYDPFVHGLLQTEAYAHAVLSSDTRTDRKRIDTRVEFRLARQRAIKPGSKLSFVLAEAALRTVVGSSAVMGQQIEHLLNQSTVYDIRYRPFDAGPHPVIYEGFALLEFSDPLDPNLVYVEGKGLTDKRELAVYGRWFDELRDSSHPIEELK